MPRKELKYPKLVATRVPLEVREAINKLVKEKQKDYPRYTEGDAVRSALVNHLKAKGFLDKGKKYL